MGGASGARRSTEQQCGTRISAVATGVLIGTSACNMPQLLADRLFFEVLFRHSSHEHADVMSCLAQGQCGLARGILHSPCCTSERVFGLVSQDAYKRERLRTAQALRCLNFVSVPCGPSERTLFSGLGSWRQQPRAARGCNCVPRVACGLGAVSSHYAPFEQAVVDFLSFCLSSAVQLVVFASSGWSAHHQWPSLGMQWLSGTWRSHCLRADVTCSIRLMRSFRMQCSRPWSLYLSSVAEARVAQGLSPTEEKLWAYFQEKPASCVLCGIRSEIRCVASGFLALL